MQKPSEMIKEMAESNDMPFEIRGARQAYIISIMKYLDEQYEKDKKCYDPSYTNYDECMNCGRSKEDH